MEALSPRDVNVNLKKKQSAQKAKAPAAKVLQREKDHPPPPPPDVQEPPSADRKNGAVYKTGRLLGKGGFAICYEGQLAGTRQNFALKIVKSTMAQKKMEQKFQTELQIHSKMRHPNIVQFHRAFTFQESTYIVLELCPNGSLMDMVKKRRFLTEPEVRFYTIQIAGAVKYMHSKGIIHRDLKMGNIFLDKNMNIKVGDFGLAALLMSGKDMTACRRTTLCGTPNYIAPEILEKGKGGHDHAVDIWSVGIIIFAMLTGRPPFQASTQDEIYRRARELEYEWPKLSTGQEYVSQEAKDLVSGLLKGPEERPDPDTIVQHPFFTSGYVLQEEEMSPEFRESPPDPKLYVSGTSRTGKSNPFAKNHKKLCIKSDVGKYAQSGTVHSSTYREVAAEEKAGLTPAVPLPPNVVYRPFDDWLREQAQLQSEFAESSKRARQEADDEPRTLYQPSQSIPTSSRSVPQSFAAQQRSQNLPAAIPSSTRSLKSRPEVDIDQPKASTRRPLTEAVVNGHGATSMPSRRIKIQPRSRQELEPEVPTPSEALIAVDLAQKFNEAHLERQLPEQEDFTRSENFASLFSSQERPQQLPNTRPDQILKRLQTLHAELERALNARSVGNHREPPMSTSTIVVKWVDYTNKFGLGYILSDGSVGCIFKALSHGDSNRGDSNRGTVPPTCVIVRDAERHLQNRGNHFYADRHQLVPVSGADIEFYENNNESGISRVNVNPRNFVVKVGPNGEVAKLTRGKDEYEDRKREKIVLWKKFANYMTAFGKDQDYPIEAQKSPQSPPSSKETSGNVVTFYQRFGDVGIWGFCDGHFQFNFPDHTKIVISGDGLWCDFYHLSLEAARDLAQNGTLSASALDDRQHLSYPLQHLLNFVTKPSRSGKVSSRSLNRPQVDPMIQGIPTANDFRKKIDFIKIVVGEWVMNGGMGNSDMSAEGRLRWLGHREKVNVKMPYKHVWVTVGARGGDDRRVAWFDPRSPEQVVPDIEA